MQCVTSMMHVIVVCNLAETGTCIMHVTTVLFAQCALWRKCYLHDASCDVAHCLHSA